MEITKINMLSDIGAGIKCLKNPSLISRFSPLPPHFFSFCKWSTLFLALFTTFTSLLRNIKLLIIPRINSWVSPSKPIFNQLLTGNDDDFDFSDDDDDDEFSSSGSLSDDDDEEDIDIDSTFLFEARDINQNQNDNYFSEILHGENGTCGLRRVNGFSWSDFSAGKSVVKLWNSFGFAVDDYDENYAADDEVSTWEKSNIFGGKCNIPACLPAAAVVLSAEMSDGKDCVVVSGYDTRMKRCETPAISGEWRLRREKVVTVGDLRKVKTPLGELTLTDLVL